jgi:hypothetical protein
MSKYIYKKNNDGYCIYKGGTKKFAMVLDGKEEMVGNEVEFLQEQENGLCEFEFEGGKIYGAKIDKDGNVAELSVAEVSPVDETIVEDEKEEEPIVEDEKEEEPTVVETAVEDMPKVVALEEKEVSETPVIKEVKRNRVSDVRKLRLQASHKLPNSKSLLQERLAMRKRKSVKEQIEQRKADALENAMKNTL